MADADAVKAGPPTPSSYLIPEQIAVLLAPIKEHRVGRDGKNFSHVEAYELRAHLNRILGFARWSEDVTTQECVFESSEVKTGKSNREYIAWTVCYRSLVRLTVCAPDGTVLATYTEGATGDAQNQPSRADAHDLAAKTSASQAFKRCCMNLGDSFGLSLYRKGSLEALVKVTLVNGQGGTAGSHEGDVQDAAPVTFRSPDPEPDGATHGAGAPPAETAAQPETPPPLRPGKTADEWREAILAAADRKSVVHALRDLSQDGLADAEVADENGEAVTLTALAQARMKVTS